MIQRIYIIADLILMSPDPAQLLQEMSFLICLSTMRLYTNRGLEKLCNPVIRKGLDDASVVLDGWLDRFGTDAHQQRRVLPVHQDPGVRKARLAAATSGGSEDSNGRRCGNLGGMFYVGDIGCAIGGTKHDTDIGGDSSGDSYGGTCDGDRVEKGHGRCGISGRNVDCGGGLCHDNNGGGECALCTIKARQKQGGNQ